MNPNTKMEETIQINYRLRGRGARGIKSAYKSWVEASTEVNPYVASSDSLDHLPSRSELIFLKHQAKTKIVNYLKEEESRKAYTSMVEETLMSEDITI